MAFALTRSSFAETRAREPLGRERREIDPVAAGDEVCGCARRGRMLEP